MAKLTYQTLHGATHSIEHQAIANTQRKEFGFEKKITERTAKGSVKQSKRTRTVSARKEGGVLPKKTRTVNGNVSHTNVNFHPVQTTAGVAGLTAGVGAVHVATKAGSRQPNKHPYGGYYG